MRYPTLLFDLDHTLLDSDESERLAYAHTMSAIGLDDPGAHFDRYVAINREMWRLVEAGDLGPGDVRHRRFERFNADVGIDADPHEMAELFVEGLSTFGDLYDGVLDLLEALAGRATLGMITNGLSRVQRSRIERLGLGEVFHTVVISEEVGVTKPGRAIFDVAFTSLGRPDPATVLMVGDSLSSDIAGGHNAGVDTCWFNPGGSEPTGAPSPTYEIRTLGALTEIAVGA